MARQIYRTGQDIYDASSNQKLGYTDFVNNWSGKSDVQDLGQREPTAPIVPTTPIAPTPSPVIEQAYGNDAYSNLNFQTPDERSFIDQYGQDQKTAANQTIDESSIRSNSLNKFQAEIDALNRVYAEKKREEMVRGEGRLGSVAAVGARRGLIGSDFGIAQEHNQTTANVGAVNAIEDERLMKEQNILSEVRKYSDAEIKAKTDAKRQGADNYLDFIAKSSERKEKNVKDIVKKIYAAGEGASSDWAKIANEMGVSMEVLKSTYDLHAAEEDKAIALQEQEAAKKADEAKAKQEQDMLKQGYNYVNTPAERDRLKAQGYEMAEINGRTYSKKPKLTTKTQKIGSTTYSITTDEMGNVVKKTPLGSSGSGVPPAKKFNEKEAKGIVEQFFYGEYGEDKKISPDNYNAAKESWIADGGTAESFDSNFYKLKNPENQYYN